LTKEMSEVTFGVLVGNRGFFPDELVRRGRKKVVEVLDELGYGTVVLSEEDTECGAVETREDAKKCAALFAENAEEIDGVLVTLPNFGDEKAVAETLRNSGLDVPVLVHAFPDERESMDLDHRRDSFCGKLSVCNNLKQYGISFSLTNSHVVHPDAEEFTEEVDEFARVCRVVRGVKGARLGAIGARTGPFNTVRFSEKILERRGISVETIDLSEIIGAAEELDIEADRAQEELEKVESYVPTGDVPRSSVEKIARLSAVINDWIAENDLDATAVQCWSAIEEIYGVVPCTAMSMMSEGLLPSACEVDVMGALAMYSLQLASGQPAALADWNNNYGEEEDKVVTFHCSNLPRSFFSEVKMSCQDILAEDVGVENTYGTCVGRIAPGPATFFRLSTADNEGVIKSYLTEGRFTADELDSFGGYGVAKIEGLQQLLRHIASEGFEHHVAMTKDHVASALEEALRKYLDWDLYRHQG